jgi:hypothetical protein
MLEKRVDKILFHLFTAPASSICGIFDLFQASKFETKSRQRDEPRGVPYRRRRRCKFLNPPFEA